MTSPASSASKRRTATQISLPRASRLHRLVCLLLEGPRRREDLLTILKIGLRTFYRELEFLQRRGLKVQRDQKSYLLKGTLAEAESRLPFPDPLLSFAEMASLAQLPGETPRRLAALLERVIHPPEPKPRTRSRKKPQS